MFRKVRKAYTFKVMELWRQRKLEPMPNGFTTRCERQKKTLPQPLIEEISIERLSTGLFISS
jgi:hypothetical protein